MKEYNTLKEILEDHPRGGTVRVTEELCSKLLDNQHLYSKRISEPRSDPRTFLDRAAVILLFGLMIGYFIVGPIFVYVMEW
jgi:hypothetical protein